MKISFIWDWEPELSQTITWMDGLAAALKDLSTRHEVQLLIPGKPAEIEHPYFTITQGDIISIVRRFKPDVILHWADMTRPHAKPLAELGIPQAICFAGGEPLGENYPYFDHIFVESQVYKEIFDKEGLSCSVAFGTNTELFKPVEQPKMFDTIFPATFAAWKRHDLYTKATKGLRALACGYMYDSHEQECWQDTVNGGVMILPHVSAQVLHRLYAASKCCVITSASNGGSQRSVLEAMSMNLPLVVTDSDKFDYAEGHAWVTNPEPESIREAIDEALEGKLDLNTRQYIVDNWSEFTYAKQLEEGLLTLANGYAKL